MKFRTIGRVLAGATAAGLALALTACSSGTAASSATAESFDSSKQYNITVWSWEPTIAADSDVLTAFKKAYPNINVTVTNVGSSADQYTALSNALQAGSGLPDVAQIEYYALPQYAIGSNLADLSSYGASDLSDKYTTGTWNSVNQTTSEGVSGIYGLPVDSGPMALFYNKTVFDKAGIADAPKTWDEFYEDAKKIHALGDKYYITSDSGDAGFMTSMIWSLDPSAIKVDGTNVTVDFSSEKVSKFVSIWQKLIDENLISTTIGGWSDDWFKGLSDGTLASLVTGAWMPANLMQNSPKASGNFRVALAPTIDGTAANSENGGSSLAVLQKSENKAAAYKFVEFVSAGDGEALRIQAGNFPALKSTLANSEFLSSTGAYASEDLLAYFGGQEYNTVLAQAAADVNAGWTYLPFQVAANSKFADTVGQAFSGKTSLTDGLSSWADTIVEYGNGQGYTVTKG